MTGRLLDGRYLVDELIARGGMASVYRATDTRLERAVAIKVMHPALAEDAAFVNRFNTEARAAARITHPNVVAVTDQGADGGTVFLVMEYVDGRTLRDLLRERGRLSPSGALAIMEPVLEGLAAAHAAGLVHRDVKPENVLLSSDGRVKVTDFGLARAVEASPLTATTGLLLGTVAYLAPEQVASGAADARTDVYAAGVMLHELLTGVPPHTGDTPLAVAYKHLNDDVPAPSAAVPGLPPILDALVAHATSRDPARRPADAAALLAELRTARRVVAMSGPAMSADDTSVISLTDSPTVLTQLAAETTLLKRPAPAARKRRRWPGWLAPRSRKGLVIWTFVLLAALLAGGTGWWLGSGRYVDAPPMVGLTPAAAAQLATKHDLHIKTDPAQVYDETVPAGKVARQNPAAGQHVRRGGTVTLKLSRGPLRYTVPNVVGKTVEDARNALLASHLTPGTVTDTYSDTVRAGRVASTTPAASESVKTGTVVALVMSKGPAPVDVPDVRGKSQKSATQTLTAAGFTVGVTTAFSDTVNRGDVISQSPPGGAGAQAPKGSTVTITVSQGPKVVEVPDVRGMSSADAQAALAAVGLGSRIVLVPPGGGDTVVGQDPGSGHKVRSGSVITLYVA